MRGLMIMSVIFSLFPHLFASYTQNNQQNSKIPHMRTGHSLLLDDQDIFQSASRRFVLARFSEVLNNSTTEVRAQMLNSLSSSLENPEITTEIKNARMESTEELLTEIQHSMASIIRSRLSPTFHAAPDNCILSSGLTKDEQSPLAEAGCYIRLGQSLKCTIDSKNLTSSAFLKAGQLYATIPQEGNRADLLLSAAECYYWAYCNEDNLIRKEQLKTLSAKYFDYAQPHAVAFNNLELIRKIQKEKDKLN